jgi:hypothetical protein
LDDPGRVRSQITSVVCQIQRFDFDCNLVVTRKLIIRIPAGLGLNPLYWYFRFNENFTEDDISKTEDDISKNDFDGASSLFFTQVRLFVLILNYNCFTHELHMPEVLFFLKK